MQGGDPGGWKIVLGAGLCLLVAVSALAFLDGQGESTPTGAGSATHARVAELEARVARLERELQRVTKVQLEPLPAPRPVGALPRRAATSDATPEVERPTAPAGGEPRAHLERYVRSFEGGGAGSEYFRLAVDAYAPELLHDLCGLVRDDTAPAALRASLALILGTPRFSRDRTVIDVLVGAVRPGSRETVALAALAALEVVGDASTVPSLEQLAWGEPELDARLLPLLMILSGEDANRTLQRLFLRATNGPQRVLAVTSVVTTDPESGLDLLMRAASGAEVEVRLAAAYALQRFRGPRVLAVIGPWLAREPDENVRRLLEQAQDAASSVRGYAAQKAVGPPDAQPTRDDPNAWAHKTADMGLVWLELSYAPRRASALRIHEVLVPGAVVQVTLTFESGRTQVAWAGEDPTTTPGVFEVRFEPTEERVKAVRLVLDTSKRSGWSEIDAVELVGPEGSAWAEGATASSTYGE